MEENAAVAVPARVELGVEFEILVLPRGRDQVRDLRRPLADDDSFLGEPRARIRLHGPAGEIGPVKERREPVPGRGCVRLEGRAAGRSECEEDKEGNIIWELIEELCDHLM